MLNIIIWFSYYSVELILIEQHAAHERVRLDTLIQAYRKLTTSFSLYSNNFIDLFLPSPLFPLERCVLRWTTLIERLKGLFRSKLNKLGESAFAYRCLCTNLFRHFGFELGFPFGFEPNQQGFLVVDLLSVPRFILRSFRTNAPQPTGSKHSRDAQPKACHQRKFSQTQPIRQLLERFIPQATFTPIQPIHSNASSFSHSSERRKRRQILLSKMSRKKTRLRCTRNELHVIFEEIGLRRSPDVGEQLLTLFKRIACRGAVQFGMELRVGQCERIARALFLCEDPWHCAHGRPTLVRLMQLAPPL